MLSINEGVESIIAAATIAVLLPLSPLVCRWYNRAGATYGEYSRDYPHDARVADPRQAYTRARKTDPESVAENLLSLADSLWEPIE